MKNRTFARILTICFSLAIFCSVFCPFFFGGRRYILARAEQEATESEILIEKNSLRVLHASNERIKRGVASTTKILTAITVIENCPLDKEVVIPKEAEGVEGSSIYLRAGEKLTVEELLYGLMLRSGNDSAVALAIATSGSVEKFVYLMNKTARRCGALDSNFTNPHGLDDKEHYSTAYDLALITAHALKNPIFQKIVDTENVKISNDNFDYPRVLINKNKLLYKNENFDGVKTGYTKKCGRCLVASETVDGMQLIAVVLNVAPMFERCEELLKYGHDNYSLTKILEKGKEYGKIDSIAADGKDYKIVCDSDFYYPLTLREKNDLFVKVENEPQFIPKSNVKEISLKIEIFSAKDLIYCFRYAMIIQRKG